MTDQGKLRMSFSDIIFESRLLCLKAFPTEISDGPRIGKEAAVATGLILFILLIEISLFYHMESQFYKEDSSVGYLMLGTPELRVIIFSKKSFLIRLYLLLLYMALVTPMRPKQISKISHLTRLNFWISFTLLHLEKTQRIYVTRES